MNYLNKCMGYMAKWLKWVNELRAIAQNGIEYTKDPYDKERFNQLMDISAEIISSYTNLNFNVVKNIVINEKGYATPKVGVRGAVFKDQKILLVRQSDDKNWSLPGGWADINELPSYSVIKEIEEESGYLTKVTKLVALQDRNQHLEESLYHEYICFFLCDLISGRKKLSVETIDVDFFSLDNLPPLSKKRINAKQINLMFEHYKNPKLPTYFD